MSIHDGKEKARNRRFCPRFRAYFFRYSLDLSTVFEGENKVFVFIEKRNAFKSGTTGEVYNLPSCSSADAIVVLKAGNTIREPATIPALCTSIPTAWSDFSTTDRLEAVSR